MRGRGHSYRFALRSRPTESHEQSGAQMMPTQVSTSVMPLAQSCRERATAGPTTMAVASAKE
eukprot:6212562-Pyramimonas_sp.AAC.1